MHAEPFLGSTLVLPNDTEHPLCLFKIGLWKARKWLWFSDLKSEASTKDIQQPFEQGFVTVMYYFLQSVVLKIYQE